MGVDMMRCEVVQYMCDSADHLVVLTDSGKFSKQSLVHQFSFNQVSQVITDSNLTVEQQKLLSSHGISVTCID